MQSRMTTVVMTKSNWRIQHYRGCCVTAPRFAVLIALLGTNVGSAATETTSAKEVHSRSPVVSTSTRTNTNVVSDIRDLGIFLQPVRMLRARTGSVDRAEYFSGMPVGFFLRLVNVRAKQHYTNARLHECQRGMGANKLGPTSIHSSRGCGRYGC